MDVASPANPTPAPHSPAASPGMKWLAGALLLLAAGAALGLGLLVYAMYALLGIKYGDQNQLGRLNETYRLSTYIPVISDELKALSAAVADTRDAVKALDERIARLE